MQSAYHNLPTVNGTQQAPGRQYAARNVIYRSDDQMAELTLDIAGAYPEEVHTNTWIRTVTLNHGKDITITDNYDLKAVSGDLILNLLTPCHVLRQDSGRVVLKASQLPDGRISGAAYLHYDGNKLTAATQEITIEDNRLKSIWGSRLTRISLKANNPSQKDTSKLRITKL